MGIYIPTGGGGGSTPPFTPAGVVYGQNYLVNDPNNTVGDQTSAFQAAINATPAGGTLALPPYQWVFSNVTCPVPIRMVGAGWGNVTGRYSPTVGVHPAPAHMGTVMFSTFQGYSDTCTSFSNNATTITTANPWGFNPGEQVTISGFTGGAAAANGTWNISNVNNSTTNSTFTIPVTTTAAGTGGTLNWTDPDGNPLTDTCTSATGANNTTVTTAAAHSFVPGQVVLISGMTGGDSVNVNQWWSISSVTSSTQFVVSASTTVSGTGGTINWGAAIDCTQTNPANLRNAWVFQDFALRGPGAGRSVGLQPPPHVGGEYLGGCLVRNVYLGNWFLALAAQGWEECRTDDLWFNGNRTALFLLGAANNNVFVNTTLTNCGALAGSGRAGEFSDVTADCITVAGNLNIFYGGSFQNCTNIGFHFTGSAANNKADGFWSEQNNTYAHTQLGLAFVDVQQEGGHNTVSGWNIAGANSVIVNNGRLTLRDTQMAQAATGSPYTAALVLNGTGSVSLDNSFAPVVQNNVGAPLNLNNIQWAGWPGRPTNRPNDDFTAWTFDPVWATTSFQTATGMIYLARISADYPFTVNNICFYQLNNATGLANCYVGIYNGPGQTLLGQSADQSTSWMTTVPAQGALQVCPLTTPVYVNFSSSSLDFYWVAITIGTATIAPQIWASQATLASISPTANRRRYPQRTSTIGNNAQYPQLPTLIGVGTFQQGPPIWMGIT